MMTQTTELPLAIQRAIERELEIIEKYKELVPFYRDAEAALEESGIEGRVGVDYMGWRVDIMVTVDHVRDVSKLLLALGKRGYRQYGEPNDEPVWSRREWSLERVADGDDRKHAILLGASFTGTACRWVEDGVEHRVKRKLVCDGKGVEE
jgi:hypothetical protein